MSKPIIIGSDGFPKEAAIVRGDLTDNGTLVTSPSTGATVALDRNTYKNAIVTVPDGATLTFTIANMVVGDTYRVDLKYSGTSAITINWFATLVWRNSSGTTAPTYTKVNGKIDSFVFTCESTGNYLVDYVLSNGTL